jgi:hypothetical protein
MVDSDLSILVPRGSANEVVWELGVVVLGIYVQTISKLYDPIVAT